MANKLLIKKSSVAAKVPVSSDLEYGELAINYADGKLYFKSSTNSIEHFGSTISGTVTSVDNNTGNITSGQLLTAIKKEDGANSGLDADLLDGQQGSYYSNYRNLSNRPISASNTPPVNPIDNDLWWDTDSGTLFIYYNDGSSQQWVEATPQVLSEGPAGTFTLTGNLITTLDLTVQGTLYETSDAKLKKNINQISDATSTVRQLRGVSFNWAKTDKPAIGVIAQEIETVLPFVVQVDATGNKTVNYTSLVGLLIESIKELEQRIEELEKKPKTFWQRLKGLFNGC